MGRNSLPAAARSKAKAPAVPVASATPIGAGLDPIGTDAAARLTAIVAARGQPGKYEGPESQVVQAGDPDAEAVALRERVVRHGLDAIAGVLLPESLVALRQVLAGTHPAGPKGAASVNGAAKLVFDALRMTGSHVIDRDRTKGADALTIAELESEVARTRAALDRKLAAAGVVSTQTAAPAAADRKQ